MPRTRIAHRGGFRGPWQSIVHPLLGHELVLSLACPPWARREGPIEPSLHLIARQERRLDEGPDVSRVVVHRIPSLFVANQIDSTRCRAVVDMQASFIDVEEKAQDQ